MRNTANWEMKLNLVTCGDTHFGCGEGVFNFGKSEPQNCVCAFSDVFTGIDFESKDKNVWSYHLPHVSNKNSKLNENAGGSKRKKIWMEHCKQGHYLRRQKSGIWRWNRKT